MLIEQPCPYMVLLRDGVYPGACYQACGALYRPFSPLPDSLPGGLFSVALSLGSPPLDVIQHPDPVKPTFSPLSGSSIWLSTPTFQFCLYLCAMSIQVPVQRFAQHRHSMQVSSFSCRDLFVLSGLFGQLFIALRILFVKIHIDRRCSAVLICSVSMANSSGSFSSRKVCL